MKKVLVLGLISVFISCLVIYFASSYWLKHKLNSTKIVDGGNLVINYSCGNIKFDILNYGIILDDLSITYNFFENGKLSYTDFYKVKNLSIQKLNFISLNHLLKGEKIKKKIFKNLFAKDVDLYNSDLGNIKIDSVNVTNLFHDDSSNLNVPFFVDLIEINNLTYKNSSEFELNNNIQISSIYIDKLENDFIKKLEINQAKISQQINSNHSIKKYSLGKAVFSNFIIKDELFNFNIQNNSLAAIQFIFNTFKINDLSFSSDNKKVFSFKSFSSERSYNNNDVFFKIELSNGELYPFNMDLKYYELPLIEMLVVNKVEKVNFELFLDGVYNQAKKNLDINNLLLSSMQMGNLDAKLSLQNVKPYLFSLVDIAHYKLKNLNLKYQDLGFISNYYDYEKYLTKYTDDKLNHILELSIKEFLDSIKIINVDKISKEIQNFIKHPSSFELQFYPDKPLNISDFIFNSYQFDENYLKLFINKKQIDLVFPKQGSTDNVIIIEEDL